MRGGARSGKSKNDAWQANAVTTMLIAVTTTLTVEITTSIAVTTTLTAVTTTSIAGGSVWAVRAAQATARLLTSSEEQSGLADT